MAVVRVLTGIKHPQNSVFLQARLLNEVLEQQGGVATRIHATKWVPLSELWSWIEPESPVIVHYGSFMLAAFRLARRKRTRFVYHNHTPFRFYWKWEPAVMIRDLFTELQLRLLPRDTEWVAVSPFNASCLRRLGFRCVKECPSILDATTPERKTVFVKSSEPTVVYVGRVAPHKGSIELVAGICRAARILGRRVTLEIYGDGKEGSRYLRAFKKKVKAGQGGGDLKIVWERDAISAAELKSRYERAWLYASVSRHEGFGLPACEAILAGTPSLYLECGGQESVLEGIGAVPLADESSFPERVAALLRNEAARRLLWRDQVVVASRYCLDALAPRVAATYGDLLNDGSGASGCRAER